MTVHTSVRLPEPDRDALEELARRNLRSFTAELVLAIRSWVRQNTPLPADEGKP